MPKISYSSSGVHLGAAYDILKTVAKTSGEPVQYFASVVETGGGRRLAFSADGVGTKIELLAKLKLDWISGWDCVAMNANDLLCVGAKPLWFLDYYAQGKLDKKVFGEVIRGMNKALGEIGGKLIGGETAELPGFFASPGAYDVGGFLVGEIAPGIRLGPERVKPGDLLIGISSSGPHSNGFSLIRKAVSFAEIKKRAKTMLAPTRLYHADVYPFLADPQLGQAIHSLAHITGGGFKEKMPRAINQDCRAVFYPESWNVPPIFGYLKKKTGLKDQELLGVFNMGIGFVLIADPTARQKILSRLGSEARVIGEIKLR
ncbi:MAG: phosphoribosylformylglycinamidine cyclo-ligase [Elusimicrobia bacterium]|nr:phosphoribosylformylglycinamidine cyclo-ligase [Elusimicrobiota bacterium]